jgi:hypothetical protein
VRTPVLGVIDRVEAATQPASVYAVQSGGDISGLGRAEVHDVVLVVRVPSTEHGVRERVLAAVRVEGAVAQTAVDGVPRLVGVDGQRVFRLRLLDVFNKFAHCVAVAVSGEQRAFPLRRNGVIREPRFASGCLLDTTSDDDLGPTLRSPAVSRLGRVSDGEAPFCGMIFYP